MDTTNNSGQSFGKQPPKIADLLSAPLVAAASANSYMVREQTRFLLDTCFVTKGPNLYEPLMIEMSLSKSLLTEDENHVLNRQDIVSTFKVPLLTLVPFNSLVVDNVDIDFSMEIVSYSANTSTSTTKEDDIFKKYIRNTETKGIDKDKLEHTILELYHEALTIE